MTDARAVAERTDRVRRAINAAIVATRLRAYIRVEDAVELLGEVEQLRKAAQMMLDEAKNDILGTEYSSPAIRALRAALRGAGEGG